MGLGDYIGLALARIGITKQRWARWTGKPIEEQKAGCSECHKREIAINNLGLAWQDRANRIGWWLKHRYTWLEEKMRGCSNRDS